MKINFNKEFNKILNYYKFLRVLFNNADFYLKILIFINKIIIKHYNKNHNNNLKK